MGTLLDSGKGGDSRLRHCRTAKAIIFQETSILHCNVFFASQHSNMSANFNRVSYRLEDSQSLLIV